MRPAALSFESSLYQSHGKAPSISENDTLVIHITTFYESCRPENCTGDPSEESDPMKVELVTDPMSYIVSKKGAISTCVGRFFLKRRWMGNMQALMLLLFAVVFGYFNSATVEEGRYGEIVHWTIQDMLLQSFFVLGFLFCTAHIISKDLVKISVWSFDWLVIFAMGAVAETAYFWEFLGNLENPGELGVAYIAVKVFSSVTRLFLHSTFALMDAWTISIRSKAIILCLYDLSAAGAYVYFRWLHAWSSLTICPLYNKCQTTQQTFIYAMGNIVFFSAKLTIPYLMGYPYALLSCGYVSRPKDPITSKDLYGWPLDMFLPRQSVAQRSSEWREHGSYVGALNRNYSIDEARASRINQQLSAACVSTLASLDCSQTKEFALESDASDSCCQVEEVAEESGVPTPYSTQIAFTNSFDLYK